jgi:hypothetical protein
MDQCDPRCDLLAAANSNATFKLVALLYLRDMAAAAGVATIPGETFGRINMTTTGIANEAVVAAPGAGKKIVVRSLFGNAGDANADVQFHSRTGSTNVNITPNFDLLNNGGFVMPSNNDGWFETLENQALVVTSNAAIDLIGTYKIVAI